MTSVLLLSGGIDSAVCLAMERGRKCYAIGIDYGQPHVIELQYAKKIAEAENVPFEILTAPNFKKSDDVVFNGRNFAMIGLAVAYAASCDAKKIIIGSNFTDWERFPDCRPEFIRLINAALNTADYGISVTAPLIQKTKKQVKDMALELGVIETWSCYNPQGNEPCGKCLACEVRAA